MLVALGIPVALCIGGLVPLVADVDALGVINIGNLLIGVGCVKVSVRRAVCRVEAIGVAVLADALHTGVRIAGGGGQVISTVSAVHPPGSRSPHSTSGTAVAPWRRTTGDRAGINAGDRLDLAQLHDVGGVDEHNHMGVICADVVQQILFLGGQLQHRAGVVNNDVAALLGALVLLLGGVVALACQTPDHDDEPYQRSSWRCPASTVYSSLVFDVQAHTGGQTARARRLRVRVYSRPSWKSLYISVSSVLYATP